MKKEHLIFSLVPIYGGEQKLVYSCKYIKQFIPFLFIIVLFIIIINLLSSSPVYRSRSSTN